MSVVARRNRPAAPVAFMTAGLFASFSGLLNLVSGFCLARPSLQWGDGDGRMAAGRWQRLAPVEVAGRSRWRDPAPCYENSIPGPRKV